MAELKNVDWRQPYDYEHGKDKFIFVSYSHKDEELLRNDIEYLLDAGVRIWFDHAIHFGDDWEKRVTKCIRHPDCVGACFYLSDGSVGSPQILREIKLTLEEKEKREFKTITVNVGGKKVFFYLHDNLAHLSAEEQEDYYAQYLDAFPPKVLFLNRAAAADDETHLPALVSHFDKWEVRDPEVPYAELSRFKCEPFLDGVKIISYNGFAPNLKIPFMLDGKRVYKLGMEAFAQNPKLVKVSIQEGIEILEEGCFRGCGNLEHVSLPASVRMIGYEAFRGCGSLREITFQKNVTEIGDYCFYLCKKLHTVFFAPGDERVSLGFNCFQECDELVSVTLPLAASRIGMYCFNKCERLASVIMPRAVDHMDDVVIHNCPSLRCVEFPGGLPRNFSGAIVKHCNRLERLVTPDLLLPQAALAALAGLGARHAIRLPAPKPSVDTADMTLRFPAVDHAERYEAEFSYENVDSHVSETLEVTFTIVLQNGVRTCCAPLSASFDHEHRVRFSFSDAGGGADASFSLSLRAIGNELDYADSPFSETVAYRNPKADFIADQFNPATLNRYVGVSSEVIVPAEFKHIGAHAFAFSDTLEIVRLPRELETIGERAFFHCVKLRELDWSDSLPAEIKKEAFAYCFGITELRLPYSVCSVGASAFEVCSGIAFADLSETGITRIEENAFRRCIALETVLWPKNLTVIADKAFRGCTALLPARLPDRLNRIGGSAFSFLMNAGEICLPAAVREVASDFLFYSTGISSISVDERNKNFEVQSNTLLRVNPTESGVMYDAVAYPIDGAQEIYTIPARTKKIFRYAYRDLEHMREAIIGDEVTEIEEENFSYCWSLRRVVLGKNVQKIGCNCFSHNISLEEIVVTSESIPVVDKGCFAKNAKNVRIRFLGQEYKGYSDEDGSTWNKAAARSRD